MRQTDPLTVPSSPRRMRLRGLGGRLLAVAALGFVAVLAGCATSYEIQPVQGMAQAPNKKYIEILEQEPRMKYEIVAEFSGREHGLCSLRHPYCTLEEHAQELGADAIWIQSRSNEPRATHMTVVDGRLVEVHPEPAIIIHGVLIRYLKDAQ